MKHIITRRDWFRNAILALILMVGISLILYAIWIVGPSLASILSHENPLSQTLVIILLSLLFFFSLVFFGSIAEYMRVRPGLITISIAIITVAVVAYVLNITWQMWIVFVMCIFLILLYVYYAK